MCKARFDIHLVDIALKKDISIFFFSPKKSKVYENEDDDDISDHEEEFYYQEVAVDHMSSPPTMSHRDMARPPHEDPEYQKQLRLEAVPVNTSNTESNSATAMPCVKERNNAFTILQSPVSKKEQTKSLRVFVGRNAY